MNKIIQNSELDNLNDNSFAEQLESLIQAKFNKETLSSDFERKPKADKGV